MRRNGSDLFDGAGPWSSGGGHSALPRRTGLLEDVRCGLELALARACDAARAAVRLLLFMPPPPAPIDEAYGSGGGGSSAPPPRPPPQTWEDLASRPRASRFRRSSSVNGADTLLSDVASAGDVVTAAGYPWEEHAVTTSDGYVLSLHRIPRKGTRDVVLFVHGILDTPLGWVGGGVTGSHAFAAADAGMDVWLASSRANPPFAHVDPACASDGWRYWKYTANEMALEDVAAQVDHIHVVKCAELAAVGAARRGGSGASSSSYATASAAPSSTSSDAADPFFSSPRVPAAALEAGFARAAAADAARGAAGASRLRRGAASDTDLSRADADAAAVAALTAAPPNEAELRAAAERRRRRSAEPSSPPARDGEGGDGDDPHPPPRLASAPPTRAARSRARRPDPAPPPHPRSRSPATTGSRGGGGDAATANARARRAARAGDRAASAEPYRLRCVGHSMGGAALLIYAVMCRHLGRPHHIAHLILMSPAGFQASPPLLSYPFILALPLITAILDRVVARRHPGAGHRFTLPTSPLRHVTFKLTHDLQHLPAVQELARSFMRACLSGDTSAWDRALQLPHYSARSMPCLSVHMGNHLVQWIRSGRFQLYDYGGGGGPGSNLARYGTPSPPDVASMYGLLDIPIDIVGGRADGVVAAANCERHVRAMAAAGVDVRYVEFPAAGHMDFVLSSKDDVRTHVLRLLCEKRW